MVFPNMSGVGSQSNGNQSYLNLIQNPIYQNAYIAGAILPVSFSVFAAELLVNDEAIRALPIEAKADYIWSHWITLNSVAAQQLGLTTGGTQTGMGSGNINPMQRTGS